MKRVAIIGVGLLTAGGDTLSETWDFLKSGKRAHCINYPKEERWRLQNFAHIAIDGALQGLPSNAWEVDALCIGSTSASFSEAEQGSALLPNYLVRALKKAYGISHGFQISSACASSSNAVIMGADLIRHGQARIILAGGVDEVTECVKAAFGAVRLRAEVCLPFGLRRKGVVLSEAAAFLLLAEEGIGEPICYLGGTGLTCDAHDSVAPTIGGISAVIVKALGKEQTGGVDFIVAHGTGTKVGDLSEAKAIERATPWPTVVSSYKGALGHPQGASGAVGLVLATEALRTQTAFQTLNGEFDPDIPIPIITKTTPMPLNRVLCLSYGSWGVNTAIVLEKA